MEGDRADQPELGIGSPRSEDSELGVDDLLAMCE